MQEDEPFDVAISFLVRDQKLGGELFNLLEGLSVFFFPRQQEELAATNGLESMREPFLTARAVVVLYREPWGNTNWTRVEQASITDRFLTSGWNWLQFVQLDNASVLPPWLPETHVRFALEQYGLSQLAGAIKHVVEQQGGKIEPPTALSHARRVRSEADLIADQEASFRDRAWIEANIFRDVEWIMLRIANLVAEINSELGLHFVAIPLGKGSILRDERVSINIGWKQPIYNSMEDAGIIAGEFNGPIFAREERRMMLFVPKELKRTTFTPTLSLARELRWNSGGKTPSRSKEELAQHIVRVFLDLYGKANKGQIDFMPT